MGWAKQQNSDHLLGIFYAQIEKILKCSQLSGTTVGGIMQAEMAGKSGMMKFWYSVLMLSVSAEWG